MERPFELVRHPLAVRELEVVAVRALTPRMRRVTLGGPELAGFVTLAPEDHVKLFFPAPARAGEAGARPMLPRLGPSGLVPPEGAAPIGRDYTPIHHDPRAGTVEVDFLLHGGGVGAAWAAQARPGQRLGLAGPRGSYLLRAEFAWHLFVGDETALPEMARRLAEMPAGGRAFAVLAVEDAAEEQPLPSEARLDLAWVHRASHSSAPLSARLLEAIARFGLPPTGGFAWVAGEAGEVRAVVRHLVGQVGLARASVRASGHWKRGVANHDHHQEIE